MASPPCVVVVIPAFREPTMVGGVVESIRPHVDRVVVVDDGSGDGTGDAARRAGATVLTHIANRGQGASLMTGIRYALTKGADIILTMDADGQHDPQEITAMIEPILTGKADIALGSRFLRSGHLVPLPRKALLVAATWYTRMVSGLDLTDTHNGFRAMSRHAASTIKLTQDRMAHASEILDQVAELELRYVEVPVTIRYTDYSLAKGQRAMNGLRILVDLWVGKVLG